MNIVKKLLKTRNEIRAMGMVRSEAEEIANDLVSRLPRKSRRRALRKLRNKLSKE